MPKTGEIYWYLPVPTLIMFWTCHVSLKGRPTYKSITVVSSWDCQYTNQVRAQLHNLSKLETGGLDMLSDCPHWWRAAPNLWMISSSSHIDIKEEWGGGGTFPWGIPQLRSRSHIPYLHSLGMAHEKESEAGQTQSLITNSGSLPWRLLWLMVYDSQWETEKDQQRHLASIILPQKVITQGSQCCLHVMKRPEPKLQWIKDNSR